MSCTIKLKDGKNCGLDVFYINDDNIQVCRKHGKNDICKQVINPHFKTNLCAKQKQRRGKLSNQTKMIKSFRSKKVITSKGVVIVKSYTNIKSIPIDDNMLNVFIDNKNRSEKLGIKVPSLRLNVIVPDHEVLKRKVLCTQYSKKVKTNDDFLQIKKYINQGSSVQILIHKLQSLDGSTSDSTLRDLFNSKHSFPVEYILYCIFNNKEYLWNK
jgi:hypothetical protein